MAFRSGGYVVFGPWIMLVVPECEPTGAKPLDELSALAPIHSFFYARAKDLATTDVKCFRRDSLQKVGFILMPSDHPRVLERSAFELEAVLNFLR